MSEIFEFVRVEKPDDIPPLAERSIDVALLDMNHLWPNMGHDALVEVVRETSNYFRPFLTQAKIVVRVISYEVRHGLMVPEQPGDRFHLYLGTGGPGHIDPTKNDGFSPGSQGIREDPSWEPRLFALFEAIRTNESATLLAVCHTFGVLCRWSRTATPIMRGSEKGGKSTGVRENVLSPEALSHPWFGRFASELPDRSHLRVIDNRLFDLIVDGPLAGEAIPIGYETNQSRSRGEAVTMIELARDRGGVMPRILGVNHHPEVIDRQHAMKILAEKFERDEVTAEWYEERARTLTEHFEGEDVEPLLRLTSQYTLLLPLQYHLARLIRLRRESLGFTGNFHEDQMVRDFAEAEEEVPV